MRKRNAKQFLLLVLMTFALVSRTGVFAQGWEFGNRAARLCERGNVAYEEGRHEDALHLYRDAQVDHPDRAELDFNAGLALAQQQRWEEARVAFQNAISKARDRRILRADAFYNQGLTLIQEAQKAVEEQQHDDAIKHLGNAIDVFQKSLRQDPEFGKAKRNLNEARALFRELARQIRQQPPQSGQGEGKDQEKQKDQENSERQSSDSDPENSDQKQQNQQQNQQQDSSQDSSRQDSSEDGNSSPQSDTAGDSAPESSEENTADSKEDAKKSKGEENADSEDGAKKSKAGEGSEDGKDQAGVPETPIGEMTPEDAKRLLSTLPKENPLMLQKVMQPQTKVILFKRDW